MHDLQLSTKKLRASPPTDAEFAKFLKATRGEMEILIRQLSDGVFDAREWGEMMQQLLILSHGESWALGRQRAGDFADETRYDHLVGIAKADSQAPYLLNLIEDLTGERYLDDLGKISPNKLKGRLNLYAQSLRGTATDSFINASDALIELNWTLGGVEKHCSDCPRYASMNPWYKDTLYAWPGSGDTPCLGNCKCHLVREDGVMSFKPVTL